MTNKKESKESFSLQQIALIKQMLTSAEKSISSVKRIISAIGKTPPLAKGSLKTLKEQAKELPIIEEGRVIEGVFDGQNMIGPNEKLYPVPPNYASKSKLVEGDILKLTIGDDGSFIFKQIGPIERKKVIGVVTKEDDEYRVVAGDKSYKVLMASITYFKAEPGDEVTIILPKDRESTWAAIENVIKKSSEDLNLDLEEEKPEEKKTIQKTKEEKKKVVS